MNVRLSLPAFGAAAGLVIGLADAAILPISVRFRGAPTLPAFTSLGIVWTWVTILTLIGVVFSVRNLHRVGVVLMLFAGPGLLLLSRAAEAVKQKTQWSTTTVLLAWLMLLILAALPLLRLQFTPARARGWWWSSALLSFLLLVCIAAEVRPADWLSPARNRGAARGHRNVVLIFLDTTRYDDAMREMPGLVRFARGATSYDNAWAPSPWTVPSHFAVLTGVDPWRLPFDPVERRFTERVPMIAERFRGRDYSTAAIIANLTVSPEAGFGAGFDEFTITRGTGVCRSAIGDLLSRLWLHDLPRPPLCSWFLASEVTHRAERFIRRAQRPYFLALNYMDAHDPYYVPPECRAPSFQPLRRAERIGFLEGDPRLHAYAHEQYRASLRCMDRSLAKLFATLERDPDYAPPA